MTTLSPEAKANTSPALTKRHKYPVRYKGRVPLKIKCLKTVVSDLWFFSAHSDIKCDAKKEYYVWVNAYGAVSAILPSGKLLGLKPDEFEVTEWHETKK
jgi:hypothetical protein